MVQSMGQGRNLFSTGGTILNRHLYTFLRYDLFSGVGGEFPPGQIFRNLTAKQSILEQLETKVMDQGCSKF